MCHPIMTIIHPTKGKWWHFIFKITNENLCDSPSVRPTLSLFSIHRQRMVPTLCNLIFPPHKVDLSEQCAVRRQIFNHMSNGIGWLFKSVDTWISMLFLNFFFILLEAIAKNVCSPLLGLETDQSICLQSWLKELTALTFDLNYATQ